MVVTMTTQTAPRTSQPARSAVQLDAALRQHRCEVVRWALSAGRPLNLDAITVIIAARQSEAVAEGRPFTRWTTNTVLMFLFGTATQWCNDQAVELPTHAGESLFTYLAYLNANHELASGSSPIGQLRRSVCELAGLNTSGHRPTDRSHPTLAETIELHPADD